MNSIVTAVYDTRAEADRGLQYLMTQLALAHADVYEPTDAGVAALQRVSLTPWERTVCEEKLATGGYMLLARLGEHDDPDRVISVLEGIPEEPPAPALAQPMEMQPVAQAAPVESTAEPIVEEPQPLVDEAALVRAREVVRGGAIVRARLDEGAQISDRALFEEFARAATRPPSIMLRDEELGESGLLRDRVIEIAQVWEEPLISKEPFVREEVVVTKTIERRMKQIHETVRRTETETQVLGTGLGTDR